MKKHFIAAGTFIALLALDIYTKFLVELNIAEHDRIDVLGKFVQLTKIYNTGGVFGILPGKKTIFLIISIVVLLVLIGFYIYEKQKSVFFCLVMGMVFSGAVGNILDRLMNRPGVVDFIYVGIEGKFKWPAFNVADSAIVVGAISLGIIFWLQEREQNRIERKAKEEDSKSDSTPPDSDK